MKKIVFLCVSILLTLVVRAQNISEYANLFDYYSYEYQNLNKYDWHQMKDKHVKELTETCYGKHAHIANKYTFGIDGQPAQIIVYEWMFNKNFRQKTFTSQGSRKTPNYVSVNGKGKEIRKTNHVYGKNSMLAEESKYKRGKLSDKITYKYDSTRMLESYYFIKDETNPRQKWVYEYYPDKSKKSSTLYNHKGKIEYVWNYECKPEGELAKKHKDTTEICRNVETDQNGNRTVTLRNFDDKGKPYKEVMVYNKDNGLIESAYYNSKDILRYKNFFGFNNTITKWIRYNCKGIETYRDESTFNSKNLLTEHAVYRKQKLVNKKVNEYNASDLLTSSKFYDKKGKVRFYYDLTYNENNLLISSKSYKHNGKPRFENKFTYSYY